MMPGSRPKKAFKGPCRIGVDVGGTFTDIVLVDGSGTIRVDKVPSIPADPSAGVLNAVDALAGQLSLSASELLSHCIQFMHASTIATNIVLERRGARTGMLVTRGFRDSIAIRRGIRQNAWQHRIPFAPVLVPRHLRIPVSGRIDRSGREIEPLSLDDVRNAAAIFREEQVESIAVCLFNSFLTHLHERQAAELLAAECPRVSITLSSEVAPIIGEYERGSTAVLNAYVSPRIVSYLTRLEAELTERGLKAPFYVVQNNAGAATVEGVKNRAVALLLSGPAAGLGALDLYSQSLDLPDILSMEIGGTSCDVTLLSNGSADVASQFELGGYHVALPSIDIHSIGAGGGTIAGIDRAGLLFVGPRGAGADPGPAAYGLGGEEPTTTDAQLVLGRLLPGPLAGGGRTLDLARAEQSIDARIARPLGLSVETAAAGMLRILDQQLFHAVQKLSAERGYDPRKFVLVAAGGAGPMHGSSVGKKLKCRAVYIPRLAGTFCALGMLNIPIKHEFSRVLLGRLDQDAWATLHPAYEILARQARDRLCTDGFTAANSRVQRELELRHPGQIDILRIPVAEEAPFEWRKVREDFLNAYERCYGHRDTESEIEIAGIRVIASGLFAPLAVEKTPQRKGAEAPFRTREVYFDETGGRVAARIYVGSDLSRGQVVPGPAIIEEDTTSVIVAPGDQCTIDAWGNYVIRFEKEQAP